MCCHVLFAVSPPETTNLLKDFFLSSSCSSSSSSAVFAWKLLSAGTTRDGSNVKSGVCFLFLFFSSRASGPMSPAAKFWDCTKSCWNLGQRRRGWWWWSCWCRFTVIYVETWCIFAPLVFTLPLNWPPVEMWIFFQIGCKNDEGRYFTLWSSSERNEGEMDLQIAPSNVQLPDLFFFLLCPELDCQSRSSNMHMSVCTWIYVWFAFPCKCPVNIGVLL